MNTSELQKIKQRYNIVGNSDGLNRALDVALQVAPTALSVLIVGESGVEVVGGDEKTCAEPSRLRCGCLAKFICRIASSLAFLPDEGEGCNEQKWI